LGIVDPQAATVSDLSAWLTERKLFTKFIQQQLLRAQQRMKSQADKNRTEREFQVGDQVYLKLQPHVQSSVAMRSNNKLAFKFYGPFVILARVGKVAYKLDLPSSALIHPVVHVSQLKKHVPPHTQVLESLDSVATDPSTEVLPIQVLQAKFVVQGRSMAPRVLVQWSNQPKALATWEEPQEMQRRYPTAWGQAVDKGGGNVMTSKDNRKARKRRKKSSG
jgi:hypothetical protein